MTYQDWQKFSNKSARFEDWLQYHNLDNLSILEIKLLERCWNFATEQAAEIVGMNEGVDFGISELVSNIYEGK